jgi:hypothetical protein
MSYSVAYLKIHIQFIKGKQEEKTAGGVAEVVERLPSKCEALSSNPSTAKKRKEKT